MMYFIDEIERHSRDSSLLKKGVLRLRERERESRLKSIDSGRLSCHGYVIDLSPIGGRSPRRFKLRSISESRQEPFLIQTKQNMDHKRS
jgi:hypothetical protein